MTDPVQMTFDLVALGAFAAFTLFSFRLAVSMKGSGLKKGFTFAGTAGLVHIVANSLTVAGDFGLVETSLPLLAFSVIQALFAVLLALAVQSFFPAWYKAFKKDADKLPGFP